jgi:hypothetical protein
MNPNLLRLLALLLSLMSIGLALFLRNKRNVVRILIPLLAFFLFLYKSIETIYWVSVGAVVIPYEISHLAYFVVPLLFLIGFSGSDYAAGSLAFICGAGFLLGATIKPDDLIANMSLYEDVRLLLTHELLFLLALLSLFGFRRLSFKDYWAFIGMMICFLVYFLLLRYRCLYQGQDFSSFSIALRVMDGSLVNYLIPNASTGWQIAFAVFCISLIFLVPGLLIPLNQKLFALNLRKGQAAEEDVVLSERYGLVPFWIRKKKNTSSKG